MKRPWLAVLASLILIALGGCGSEDTSGAASSSRPSAVADAETPAAAGAATAALANTDPCDPPGSFGGDASAGAVVYQQYCNLCHGPDAPPMEPQPVDHQDCAYMGTLSDAHLFKVVCGGGGAVGKSPVMPAWRDIVPADDIVNLVAHLRSLCPS